MPRRALVLLLALLQTLLVLAGARAAGGLQRPLAVTAGAAPAAGEPVLHTRTVTVHVQRPAPVRQATPKATRAAAPRPRPRPRPRVVHHAAPRRTRVVAVVAASRPRVSQYDRMMAAVARIPGYRKGDATWVISSRYGHWGMADLGRGIVYVSPSVPADRMYDVVAHEWSHLLMVTVYGGEVNTALFAANAFFGGSELTGAERAADCMARLLGARWTHYTSCTDARWRDGARRLVNRQRL